ncbi:MAG: O-antigen ligase family protein [Rhodospirillales bacterium]
MAPGLGARALGPADALALALFVAPPLAVYAPAAMAPLAVLAALAIILAAAINRRLPALGAPIVFGLLLLVAVWGALTALWSIRPDESLKRALQLAGIFFAGCVLIGGAGGLGAPQRRRVAVMAAWGVALALALILVERLSGDVLRRLVEPGYESSDSAMKRASTLLVLLSAAPAAFLWRDGRRGTAAALIFGVGAATLLLDSISARLAFAAAALFAALAWRLPRIAAGLLAACIAAAILLAPVAARLLPGPHLQDAAERGRLPASAAHRAMIWRYAAGKIAERPLLGFGLDTARSLPDARTTIRWDMGPQPPAAPRYSTVVQMPLHPHNAPLQWWMELGLPGALLGAAVALLALAAAQRGGLDRADRAAATGLVAAGMTVAIVSYGAWQSWWLLTMFLAAAGMAAVARSP